MKTDFKRNSKKKREEGWLGEGSLHLLLLMMEKYN
jgi:hypothetical protein